MWPDRRARLHRITRLRPRLRRVGVHGVGRTRRGIRQRFRLAVFLAALAVSRFSRDQRATKLFGLAHGFLSRRAVAARLILPGAVTLTLEERTFHMMLGDERLDGVGDGCRHRHGLDEIVAGFRVGLAFRGISRNGEHLERRLGTGRPQHHPKRRSTDSRLLM